MLEPRRRPRFERRKRNLLWLRRTVRPRHRLGQILLVVVLRVVEHLIVVGRGCDLRGDGSAATALGLERLPVGLGAGLEERLLLVVEVVEPAAVLRPAVVALTHPLRRIVRFPEPTQDIDDGDLLRVVDDLDRFGAARTTAASLFVGGVRREARGVAHSSGDDAIPRQAPDALLAAPEAAVCKDADLVIRGPRPFHLRAEDVVLVHDDERLRPPLERLVTRNELGLVEPAKAEEPANAERCDALWRR